ncbi:MAG: aldo/keto reductase [Lachnospiraceae bacterium]
MGEMKYGNVKGLDKKVSRLVFGTPHLREDRKEEGYCLLDDIYALGINTFDTAAVYPNGSEQLLLEWICDRGIRDEIVLISKCAHQNKWRRRVTSFDIMSDISDTLAKASIGYIDIYQLHRDDENVAVADIVDTCNRLYEQGKVKSFGASNWSLERILEANEYAYNHGLEGFSSVSPHFSLGEQMVAPWDGCLSLTGEENISARAYYENIQMPVFAYSSLCMGFFSGKFKADDLCKAREVLTLDAQKSYLYDENIERLRRTEVLAEKKRVSVANIAIAWALAQEINVFTLVRASSKDRMKENIKALDVVITSEELQWLNLERTGIII